VLLFVELLKQPWFAVSPSPWSMIFYAVFGLIGAWQLLRSGAKYRRWPWLLAFIDALFLLGMIVFIQDSIWLVCNTFRWILPLYSGVANFWNYYVRFAQNFLGFLLLTLLSYGNLRLRVAYFNRKTLAYLLLIACFTAAVFILAPNQGFTDWTFAVHYGYSDQVILEAFLISHVGYKALIALAFLCLFPDPGWRKMKPKHRG
jgi:hypothetical protein